MSSLFHIPERTHAGLLLLSCLARNYSDSTGFISLQEASRKMHLSLAYLEEIAKALKKSGLVEGRKGPGGGYRLNRPPVEVTAEMIFLALEGPVHLVDCQKNKAECPVRSHCHSQRFWKLLQQNILQTLRQTTLQHMLHL